MVPIIIRIAFFIPNGGQGLKVWDSEVIWIQKGLKTLGLGLHGPLVKVFWDMGVVVPGLALITAYRFQVLEPETLHQHGLQDSRPKATKSSAANTSQVHRPRRMWNLGCRSAYLWDRLFPLCFLKTCAVNLGSAIQKALDAVPPRHRK